MSTYTDGQGNEVEVHFEIYQHCIDCDRPMLQEALDLLEGLRELLNEGIPRVEAYLARTDHSQLEQDEVGEFISAVVGCFKSEWETLAQVAGPVFD